MKDLEEKIDRFVRERDWDRFHSPKNLVMALAVEVAEAAEHFQWLTQAESESLSSEKRKEVEEELADILIYLVQLARKLDIDLVGSAHRKILKNQEKYPAEQVRGKSLKYTAYSWHEKLERP